MAGYSQGQVGLSSTSRYLEKAFSNSDDYSQEGPTFIIIKLPNFLVSILKWLRPQAIHTITPSSYTPAPLLLPAPEDIPALEDVPDPTPEEVQDSSNPLASIDDSLYGEITTATPAKPYKRSKQEKRAIREVAKKVSKKEKRAEKEALRKLAAKTRKPSKKKKKKAKTDRRAKAQIDAAPPPRDMDMKPFPGRVFQMPRFQSIHFSRQLCECNDTDVLTLWTDGSLSGDGKLAGASIAYRDMSVEDKSRGREWKDTAWKVDGHGGHIGYIELSAIAGALDLAFTKVSQQTTDSIRAVFICTDSMEAIGRCQNISRIQLPLLDSLVHARAQELVALGVSLSIVWSPGHSSIEGNSRAHIAAGAVTKSRRPDEKPEKVSAPPVVSNNIRSFTICRMP